MKMLREVAVLSLLAIVALCVLNIAAASSMNASQMRSNSSTYRININQVNGLDYTYPPKVFYQVPNKLNFHVTGTLMKDSKLVKGDNTIYLYHGEVVNNVPNPTQWYVPVMPDGSFHDWFQFSTSGRHDLIYTYKWGDSLADFCQSDVISIYAVQSVP